jgi:putative membrane protein
MKKRTAPTHCPSRAIARGALNIALVCASIAGSAAHAQPGPSPHKDIDKATTHSRASDGDRVFMRSAVGLFIHDHQLTDLARTRARSPELKRFASAWQARTEKLQAQLHKVAADNRLQLPKDMSQDAKTRLHALDLQAGAGFDHAFARYAAQSLSHEIELFQDSVRKMENEGVRAWADGALRELREQLSDAQQLASKLQ